ncbi:MAG TPA: hypothetical protein DGT23_03490 [Micromonosporaceae bacterium]|nr:hypothetical protein [Micromonosporaceae bacterium]
MAAEALDRTAAAPAAQALVRVVNASPQRGEAATVTEALRQLGFSQVAPAANDPLYPAVTDPALALTCRAQIRFGQQGMPAARTLSLVEPCAELVKDDRQDATVDFAIGMRFDNLQPKPEARRVLERLAEWAAQNPEAQGGLQANASSPPSVDAGLLAAARQVNC